jgi:GNAT superfamily N-acetyltransferase
MTHAEVELRRASEHDLERVGAMSAALYVEHPGPVPVGAEKVGRTLRHFLAHPEAGAVFLVLQPSTRDAVGYAIVATFWSNEYGGPALIIDELYLVPEARGQGLGGTIIRVLEAQARRDGAAALLLEVDEDNPRARKLYESMGFQLTGRHHLRRLIER